MSLSKIITDRIISDGLKYAKSSGNETIARLGYIAGAIAQAEQAQNLVEALEWIKTYGPVDDLTIKFIDKALNEWNGAATTDRPCPHCGKELSRDRNLCCECGEEVEG